MRGTNFEFRYRFLFIALIFWVAFFCYSFDQANAGAAIGQWLAAHTALPKSAAIRLVFALGGLLTLLAAALRTWASSYLHSAVVHDPTLHSERLVADGPYRQVRNPLYVGTILLAVAMGLLASRLGMFILVAGMTLFVYRLISREEHELSLSQGENYRTYLRTVPRLLSAVSPRVPASGARPQWPQAFIGEGFFWIFTIANLGFAITMNRTTWYVLILLALPYYLVSAMIQHRRHKPSA